MSQQSDKDHNMKLAIIFLCVAGFNLILFPSGLVEDREVAIGIALLFWIVGLVGVVIFNYQNVRSILLRLIKSNNEN